MVEPMAVDGPQRRLGSVLADIAAAAAPFGDTPADTDNARWVSPIVLGSVEYREFTGPPAAPVVLDALA